MEDLSQLIRRIKTARGWSWADLEARTGGTPDRPGVGHKRLQQIVLSGLKAFPDVATIRALARALSVDESVIVQACCASLGLRATYNEERSLLVQLASTVQGTELLSDAEVTAITTMIQAAAERARALRETQDAAAPAPSAERAGAVSRRRVRNGA